MNPRIDRLLIVDDNEMNRDMLARRLARKGYEIGVADTAEGLVERIKEDHVDLVLVMSDGCAQAFGPKDEVLGKVLRPQASPLKVVAEAAGGAR